jgi:hypothetical protein
LNDILFESIISAKKRIKEMLDKLKPKDQTVNCPQCQGVVYVPTKFQQKVKVTCKKCRFRFELQMSNPITQNMDVKKSNSLLQNAGAVLKGFTILPWKAKLLLAVASLCILGLIYVVGSLLMTFIPVIFKFVKGLFPS